MTWADLGEILIGTGRELVVSLVAGVALVIVLRYVIRYPLQLLGVEIDLWAEIGEAMRPARRLRGRTALPAQYRSRVHQSAAEAD